MDRNCEGKHKPIAIKVYNEVYDRCPVSLLDADACETVAIVDVWEGGGLGGSSMMPSAFLAESKYAHNVRQIVLHEKWKVEKIKEKEDKSKKRG